MQTSEAKDLRDRWGDAPCDHPHIEKEYDLGAATGDWCCTTCGLCAWGSDWNRKASA